MQCSAFGQKGVFYFWQSVDAILQDISVAKTLILFDAMTLIKKKSFNVPKFTVIRQMLPSKSCNKHGKPDKSDEKNVRTLNQNGFKQTLLKIKKVIDILCPFGDKSFEVDIILTLSRIKQRLRFSFLFYPSLFGCHCLAYSATSALY